MCEKMWLSKQKTKDGALGHNNRNNLWGGKELMEKNWRYDENISVNNHVV